MLRLTKALAVLGLPLLGTAFADGIFMTGMQTRLTPASVSVLTDPSRIPGAQAGDIVEYVLRATVGSANATGGPGVYFTSYIPAGADVLGAWFVTDATGTTIKNPGQGGRAHNGWGLRGSKTPFGNPFSSILNGRQNDVYGDTGIFYSTDTRTQLFTADGSNVAVGPTANPLASGGISNGYNVTDTFFKAVGAFNLWDANQVNAFGAGGALNSLPVNTAPTSAATVINSIGQGVPPFGSGSMLAGPDTGYSKDNSGSVGPWQRIQYTGSQIADVSDGPATATGTADSPTVLDASALGSSLSDTAPLPLSTNAVRFAYGYGAVGDVFYVKIRMRLNSSVLAASDGVILNFESNGSDNHGSGSKDNPWRYFGPTVSQAGDLHVRNEIHLINGAPYTGGNIPAGATVTYRVRYASLSSVPVNSVTMKVTLPSPLATTGCSASSPTLGNASIGVSVLGVSAGTITCPAAGSVVTFTGLPSVSAGKIAGLHGNEFTYDVKLSATASVGTSVSNTSVFAAIDPVTSGALSTNATVSGTIGVVPQADLAIQQSGPIQAILNDTVSYSLVVANLGDSSINGATITDTVPANLANVTWTCSGHGGANCGAASINSGGSGNGVSITSGVLPVNTSVWPPTSGAYLTIDVSGTAVSAGSVSNISTVSAPSGYLDPLPNNASSQSTIIYSSVPPPASQTQLTTLCGIVWPGSAPTAGTRSALITPLAGPDVTVNTAGDQVSGFPTYTSANSGIGMDRRRNAGVTPFASSTVNFADPSNAFILALFGVGPNKSQQVYALDALGALVSPLVISSENGATWNASALRLEGAGPSSGTGQGAVYLYYPTPVKSINVTDVGTAGDVSVQLTSFCDYGDAPSSYGTTVAADGTGGPIHQMALAGGVLGTEVRDLYLGYSVAGKLNGYPSVGADTDPQDDGVSSFPSLRADDTSYSVNVHAVNNSNEEATLVAWIDFNIDGQFQDGEKASVIVPALSGAQDYAVTWNNLSGLVSGQSYARFRLIPSSSATGIILAGHRAAGLQAFYRTRSSNWIAAQRNASSRASALTAVAPTGWVPGGEIEDFGLTIAAAPVAVIPDLTIVKSHIGNFSAGGIGTYSFSLQNVGGAPTSGTITLSDTLPIGLSVNDGSSGPLVVGGTNAANWICTSNASAPQAITCTTSSVISEVIGSNSSDFSLNINLSVAVVVGTNSITNTASVAGGGQTNTANDTASDPTSVTAAPSINCSTLYGSAYNSSSGSYNQIRIYSPTGAAGSVVATYPGSAQSLALAVTPMLDSNGRRRIYYVDAANGNLIRFYDGLTDSSTGVSVATGGTNIVRMAFDANGSLYMMDASPRLWKYVPTTNTLTGPVTVADASSNGTDTLATSIGGDIAFDASGVMYLMAMNSGTAAKFRVFRVDGATGGSPLATLMATAPTTLSIGSIAYTPDGKLLMISGGASGATVYRWDLGTGVLASQPTVTPGVFDLGSCVFPSLLPSVNASKTLAKVAGTVGTDVLPGDTLEYTIVVRNTGSLIASGSTFQDLIPSGTTYVLGSTTLNGTTVADLSGNMPFVAARAINGPGQVSGSFVVDSTPATTTDNEATLKFRITINTINPPSSVSNQGTISYTGGPVGGVPTDDPATVTTGDPTVVQLLLVQLSGLVWNDANASITQDGLELGTNATALTIYAVDGGRLVIGKASVQADGTYTITGLPGNSSITLRMSIDSSVAVGGTAPITSSLPTGWVNTGENLNGTTETSTPGEIALTTTTKFSSMNFGIAQPSFSATVWIDLNQNGVLDNSEAVWDTSSLTLYLTDAGNTVVTKGTLQPDGRLNFFGIAAGTYTLILSTDSSVAVGSQAPAPSLPSGWVTTGENTGPAASGTLDGTADGKITVVIP